MSRSALLKDKDQQTAYERWELASFSDGQSQLPKKLPCPKCASSCRS